LATGTLVYPLGGVDSITGIDLAEFDAISGGFRVIESVAPRCPNDLLRNPDDMVVDEFYARANRIHAGQRIPLANHMWNVTAVVEAGKMSRMFADLSRLQDLTDNTGRLSCVYAKLSDPASAPAVISSLKQRLPGYPVLSLEELVSQMTVTNVPMLRNFTAVVIGIGAFVGFLIVFLSMYTAVLERTREVGILKALGASPWLILNVLVRETTLLALVGSALGIVMTYGVRWLIQVLVPTMIQDIVPDWWLIAAGISVAGALLGGIYPGLKAARQDVIDALAYE